MALADIVGTSKIKFIVTIGSRMAADEWARLAAAFGANPSVDPDACELPLTLTLAQARRLAEVTINARDGVGSV